MKKNLVKQSPGYLQSMLDVMKQHASLAQIPETGYHGFACFDEMSIQVRACFLLIDDSLCLGYPTVSYLKQAMISCYDVSSIFFSREMHTKIKLQL